MLLFSQLRTTIMSMVPVDLPVDILYLIVDLVGKPSHPLAYTICTYALHALCLVSRFFNSLATPILYSSITLYDQRDISYLRSTGDSNPKLLQWCNAMYWPGGRKIRYADLKILHPMTNLRRFATSQTSWRSLGYLPNFEMLLELAIPGIDFWELCHLYKPPINLERLVVKSVTDHGWDSKIESTFLKMPRLTHVRITEVDRQIRIGASVGYDRLHRDSLPRIIEYLPLSCSVIFGLLARTGSRGYRRAILDRAERRDVKVVFVEFRPKEANEWFRYDITSGKLWDQVD